MIRGILYVVPTIDPEAVPIRVLQRNTKFHKANVVVPDIETESEVDDNDEDETAEEKEPDVAQPSGNVATSTPNPRGIPMPGDPFLEESDPEEDM